MLKVFLNDWNFLVFECDYDQWVKEFMVWDEQVKTFQVKEFHDKSSGEDVVNYHTTITLNNKAISYIHW